jgi:hypothetical protein
MLIHPEDALQDGPWTTQKWDRIIDLGRAGAESYARAAATFACPVNPLDDLRSDFKEIRRVRELFALGMGKLNDALGLDWWELTCILVHQQLETVILLREFAETLGSLDKVHVSRPGFQSEALRLLLNARLHVFPRTESRYKRRAQHYLQVLKKFPAQQLAEIFWDKTDPGYQLRGAFSRRPRTASSPVVLLPTAYINVSRVGISYAESLPDTRFLLVATRRSGWIDNCPSNVAMTWLRSYASVNVPSRKREYHELMERWERLRKELNAIPEFKMLDELGCLGGFPGRFENGLQFRDAWQNVLNTEPVQAVLCADDSNRYTNLPLLLAKMRGLPTITCHHGALDGRYMFKRCRADVMLVKGRMEEDYMARVCGVPREKLEVGAPALPAAVARESDPGARPLIVLFSEVYEVSGGRARDSYQDILPSLADLAIAQGRELVIKLHPAESLSERRQLVSRILSPEQQRVARVVSGRLQPEMLDQAWFGITVLSTVSVECALRGVPCFLCSWLESWPYGYVDQFTRFGAGIRLNRPEEIRQIPEMLRNYKSSPTVRENCWTPIEPRRLQTLLGMNREVLSAATTQV